MKSTQTGRMAVAIGVAALLGACSQWQTMDQTQGAVAGAASGAVAGAVVGGPIGAVIGGVGGAYAGYGTTGYGSSSTTTSASAAPTTTGPGYSTSTVRAAQQALNDRGYNAGPADGQWGATTEDAVKRFQRASGLPETGDLGSSTLSALGVS
ncbi:MAG TPA: peptidoglycan-binding domain-containing protein [Casimicrobiaceae bacterium]|nr:peptidoglycan-binding domain-containing protein [Casimicrobiaceae bacterium]